MHRYWGSKAFAAILLFLGMGSFGLAQDSDLKKDIEELKQSQQAIRKDLTEIKALLSKLIPQAAPQVNVKGMEFDIGNNSIRGSNSAKPILVEFTDYQCPHCGRYVRETFSQILEQYVDKGVIRYAVLDLPLPMHKMAQKAAEASHCASDQGKFWEIHKLMMTKQESIEDLSSYAATLNLDVPRFEECLKTNKYQEQISKESALAQKLGIRGVPGFIIASTDPQNPAKATGISFIPGAVPFAMFQKEIDQALAGLAPQRVAQ